ncbi:unnamed protein product [Lactuca virosa]|uniref:Uncharacterized protein n=1 Tax=Lactuca virosa TaxID=75947 RepID=A0AAU9M9V3_9ASTR|nr:unnamed protein product [Lactuca virosa]
MEQNSCCSVRDPFLAPLDKKDLAEAAKAQFLRDHSDHFALVRAYEGWKVAEHALGGYEYYTGLVEGNMVIFNAWSYDENLIRLVICYGLYPGISSVIHNEKSFSLKTMEDGQVLLHSVGIVTENERDERKLEKLSLRKQLRLKSQQQQGLTLTPVCDTDAEYLYNHLYMFDLETFNVFFIIELARGLLKGFLKTDGMP